jgi:glycosyltransferase involved in cell wall biosynthesis
VRARIALNALALRPGGSGVQTYIRELLRELVPIVPADLVASVQADVVADLPAGVTPQIHPVVAGVRRAMAGLHMRGVFDLVHGLDATLPLGVRVPTVATFHDLAVFDVPWAFSRVRVTGKRVQLRHALKKADALIAVSSFTAERISARFGREPVVVPLAPPPDCAPPSLERVEDARRRYALPDRFVLHVGNVDPRKNIGLLSSACERADIPLVLAGAVVRQERVRAQILGYVPRDDLLVLYGAATVVAYPSRYEGFGLPPLEAMACGAPVVASRVASLPELLGSAARFVEVGDLEGLTRAISDVSNDDGLRKELAAAGPARASTFSWPRAARETADVYRSLGVAVGGG